MIHQAHPSGFREVVQVLAVSSSSFDAFFGVRSRIIMDFLDEAIDCSDCGFYLRMLGGQSTNPHWLPQDRDLLAAR